MAKHAQVFEALIREHAGAIAAAVRRVCLRRYDALMPDVTQEVHLAIWRAVESGKKMAHPASYIYKIALTAGLAMVEKAKKQALIAEQLSSQVQPEPPGALQPPERARLIEELLQTLDADQANALRAYLAGFNHVEIAGMFGWSQAVARHRVYRSIDALRERTRRSNEGAQKRGR